jgi:hypothetical protein
MSSCALFKMRLELWVMSMFTDVILTFSTRYRDAVYISRAFHFLVLYQIYIVKYP